MNWCRYLTEVATNDFGTIRAAITRMLGLAGDIPAGLVERSFDDGLVVTAHDEAQGFLAARWLRDAQYHEVFVVTPASKPARLGYATFGAPGVPLELGAWLSEANAVETSPSFSALTSLLVSRGSAVVEISPQERQLAEDNAYLKLLLSEQSDQMRQLQSQLREARQARGSDSEVAEVAPAATWDISGLADWCAQREDKIVVLPRARNGAKKSKYENPQLMCDALEVLAGPYREFRQGRMSREAFENAIAPYGLHLEGSVAPSVAGEQGDTYFVQWEGRRKFLEYHLLKGSGRDERFCFRMYFFWDAASQRAVVGSMPAHLNNSLT
ncbi:hypothetical protein QZN30_03740 [Burkholderia multivorans]|nr:hypothetical protein [Burkholderia multivorans]